MIPLEIFKLADWEPISGVTLQDLADDSLHFSEGAALGFLFTLNDSLKAKDLEFQLNTVELYRRCIIDMRREATDVFINKTREPVYGTLSENFIEIAEKAKSAVVATAVGDDSDVEDMLERLKGHPERIIQLLLVSWLILVISPRQIGAQDFLNGYMMGSVFGDLPAQLDDLERELKNLA